MDLHQQRTTFKSEQKDEVSRYSFFIYYYLLPVQRVVKGHVRELSNGRQRSRRLQIVNRLTGQPLYSEDNVFIWIVIVCRWGSIIIYNGGGGGGRVYISRRDPVDIVMTVIR